MRTRVPTFGQTFPNKVGPCQNFRLDMLSHAHMIKELVTRAANKFAELKTMPAASIPATMLISGHYGC